MLTGQLRNEVDKIWKEFWQNGMTDSLSIIKQITDVTNNWEKYAGIVKVLPKLTKAIEKILIIS